MNFKQLILPAMAVGTTLFFSAPEESEAFATLGFSLSLSQRDFRVFNNFTDNQANNNQTPHANYPGYQGADMAIWKACVEWGSIAHGDGSGDGLASNPIIGSGGGNFDVSFQGNSTGVGGINGNIHSEISGSQGGVLAFTESPSSNGWRIRYYAGWTWHDGPGSVSGAGNNVDLQGVAAHEYGHALGLNHSGVSGATMFASLSGSGQSARSIAADDSAGVQAIYGVISGIKPVITAIGSGGSPGTVAITGSNFTNTNNAVWFTQASAGGNGTPVKVTGVGSTNGGTQIVVTLPANAGPGDILVKRSGSGHDKLSNAWPIDPSNLGTPPGGLTITSISPSTVGAVVVDKGVTVTLQGTGFLATTGMQVDGQTLSNFPAAFQVVSDNQILITTWPLVSKLGAVDVTVLTAGGNVTSQITVIENSPPALELVGSAPGFLFNAVGINFSVGAGPGDLAWVFFSGSNSPSDLPGLLSLGIGNGFSSLFQLMVVSIGPAGHTSVALPVSGVSPGLTIHFQAAIWDISTGAFPLVSTNVQTGTFLL